MIKQMFFFEFFMANKLRVTHKNGVDYTTKCINYLSRHFVPQNRRVKARMRDYIVLEKRVLECGDVADFFIK